MTVSADSVRLYEQNLVQQAEVLALGLAGLRTTDPERATQLASELSQRLWTAAGAAIESYSGNSERPRPVLVSTRSGDEIEEFIIEILADRPKGASVQDIVEHLEEAQLAIKRQTLVVRLHRMVQSGKLVSIAHGHYALSENERRLYSR
jgi:hypothetical protein